MKTPEELERLRLDVGPDEFNFAKKWRTGRTTRMIRSAIVGAMLGRDVVVVCGNPPRLAECFAQMATDGALFPEIADLDSTSMNQEGCIIHLSSYAKGITRPTSVMFRAIGEDFDWETMRPRGISTRIVVLVDHDVIERKFRPILSAWCRFDEP